ncbi:porin PorA family protein [Nocardia aobensis]|uniref:Porin PorA family protein n=1 Tax=Nocardia aobensis TaxID=257277 RepID=A0ABW6PFH0_9NOCA
MKKSSIILMVVGVLLIVLAAGVRFVAVPVASKLPGNTDITTHYSGKASLLNAQALQTGDTAHAFLKDQDITMDRRVYVSATTSDTAVVHDDTTAKVAGQTLPDNHTYAVDRTALTVAQAPANTVVEHQSGYAVGLPIHPKADDSYALYDSATQLSSPMKYIGAESRGGRSVYHYESTAAGDVKDDSLLKTLPSALPSSLAPALAPSLPPETQQALVSAGPLPPTVPLEYQSSTTYGVWVDEQLGVPVDASVHRTITALANLGPRPLTLLPVLDTNVRSTPDSVQFVADKAASSGRLLTIISVWTPIVLLALGIVLVALAIVRRKPAVRTVPPSKVAAPTH